MELQIEDPAVAEICRGKKQLIVGFVHQHLGNASVCTVSDAPIRNGLKIETVCGAIFTDYELTKVMN